ncbi:periplasmic binding protein-like II [Neocallimastix lanati (nom. inval.)]|uniref:Periplasmic binding protein-like II n=1 Tax=Neocallimastix californiae TaxID=1754190 RepID=A0A1Y2EZW9_9FUNG|nr:periplasmic binding protein-like II [Neocallimastix sp. JGI-2020a]ORY77120.1 periplasmic binding protein-like II [Neocallimastix californiae]|eukprot:ORY77120.1 periplasmic binding protein-like II [Neocallimastix californiae]
MRLKNIGKTITIYILANSENGGRFSYDKIIDEFNKYSVNNNLNITLAMNFLSKENSTVGVTDYESSVEYILSKRSDKYDIIFFDNIFTSKFAPDFLILDDYIPKEYIDMYKNSKIFQTCYYKNKLVAFPFSFDVTALYYNVKLLQKYNKVIPKTWDELLETGKYILNKERENNNTNLIGYNGLLHDTEIGTCSVYEFIYSFRNEHDSPFPDLQSQNIKDALKKLKQIKNEISSDFVFKSNLYYTFENIFNENFIFAKLWYASKFHDTYDYTILPGSKSGISGSIIGGYSVGINKHITDEKKEASVTAFKFIISSYIQKILIIERRLNSPLSSLYDDKEVCSVVDCPFYKSLQVVTRPNSSTYNYDINQICDSAYL